jgi:hypothetical protein
MIGIQKRTSHTSPTHVSRSSPVRHTRYWFCGPVTSLHTRKPTSWRWFADGGIPQTSLRPRTASPCRRACALSQRSSATLRGYPDGIPSVHRPCMGEVMRLWRSRTGTMSAPGDRVNVVGSWLAAGTAPATLPRASPAPSTGLCLGSNRRVQGRSQQGPRDAEEPARLPAAGAGCASTATPRESPTPRSTASG